MTSRYLKVKFKTSFWNDNAGNNLFKQESQSQKSANYSGNDDVGSESFEAFRISMNGSLKEINYTKKKIGIL